MNNVINKVVAFLDLPNADYQQTWDYQESLLKGIVDIKISNRGTEQELPTPNYLLFCEHPHVYTMGKSGDEKNLLLDAEGLKQHDANYYRINRGGDITYHGPGQIVGYPILDLENFFTDIHKYLRVLEEAIIRTIADYGIEGGRIEGLTGVWIDFEDPEKARKIAALGVKTSRWVTMHGFALNVNTDLSYFDHIIPCGIDDKDVTTMEQELTSPQNMDEVKSNLKKHLVDLFGMQLSD